MPGAAPDAGVADAGTRPRDGGVDAGIARSDAGLVGETPPPEGDTGPPPGCSCATRQRGASMPFATLVFALVLGCAVYRRSKKRAAR